MGQKSINDIYTVFHALSHGIGGKYSFFQEDGELTRYHHRYIGRPTDRLMGCELRNGAYGRAAAKETLRNGALAPNSSFLNGGS